MGSEVGSFWYQQSALRGTRSLVQWSVTSQSFIWSLSSIRVVKCTIMNNMQNMYNFTYMQNMPLIFENKNTQTLPCTPSHRNAFAFLCKECNIILNCAWGPWLVQTPCSLTQSLCASAGASQLTLIASQYRATSPAVCRILWFFPVAMIGIQFPLINGNTISHCSRYLQYAQYV